MLAGFVVEVTLPPLLVELALRMELDIRLCYGETDGVNLGFLLVRRGWDLGGVEANCQ